MQDHKLPRHIRLAYLCHKLYQRMVRGINPKTTWVRHYKLTTELDREKMLLDLNGFMINARFVSKPGRGGHS